MTIDEKRAQVREHLELQATLARAEAEKNLAFAAYCDFRAARAASMSEEELDLLLTDWIRSRGIRVALRNVSAFDDEIAAALRRERDKPIEKTVVWVVEEQEPKKP
jgi:hypothetical protein